MGNVARALVFGGLGFVLAYLILLGPAGVDSQVLVLVVASGLAGFAVSLLIWRLLCGAGQPVSKTRGALAGALTGLFAHPVAWCLALVWNYLAGHTSWKGEKPIDGPLQILAGSVVLACFSLLIFGWLTVGAGAIAGFLSTRRWRTFR